MEFKKKAKIKLTIPTASMPDIIFMLLIFFMTVTVMKTYSGLKVTVPDAQKIEKLDVSKRHIATIWVDKQRNIMINDITVPDVKNLRNLAYQIRVEDPQLVVVLKADERAEMGLVNEVHSELRKGNALNIPVRDGIPIDRKIPLFIRNYIDNLLVKLVKIDSSFWQNIKVEIPKFTKEKFTLTISSSSSWTPKELGINKDTREIGIMIGEIEFLK